MVLLVVQKAQVPTQDCCVGLCIRISRLNAGTNFVIIESTSVFKATCELGGGAVLCYDRCTTASLCGRTPCLGDLVACLQIDHLDHLGRRCT